MNRLTTVEVRKARYTHRVVRNGDLCSEHTSRALAEKARKRLVAMSNGKLTTADFQIEEIGPR